MDNWTSGYVAEIDYTYGYYSELSPLRARFALESNGIKCPEIKVACELGFGQGVSSNIHAASSSVEWWGTDFNPAQASLADEWSQISGANAHLFGEAFDEFCNRKDLPDFDFIGLHGIWSWISDENRRTIVDFVNRKLKIGGILYLSYNTLPGWSSFAPMRHLMTRHAELIGSAGGGIVSQIDGALNFADAMLETKPKFLNALPLVKERMGKVKEQNRHYLAHEYFNRDWHPMYFLSTADCLGPAKVDFACSAYYLDHIDHINLTEDQRKFMATIPNAMMREQLRDFMVNQSFRRDYWVKGVRRLPPTEMEERIKNTRIMLNKPMDSVEYKVSAPLGEIALHEESYRPVFEALSDFAPRTIGELGELLGAKTITPAMLKQIATVVSAINQCQIVQDIATEEAVTSSTQELNRHLMGLAKDSGDVKYLASPVTGGGFAVNRIHQLYLLARLENVPEEDYATYAWSHLRKRGHKLNKNDKPLETEEENLEELRMLAKLFVERELPIYRALKLT